jgi:hypothetical protein
MNLQQLWPHPTAGCRMDAKTRLGSGNRCGHTGVEPIESRANLGRPCRFGVSVDFALEPLNQLAGECGSLFRRESECFG